MSRNKTLLILGLALTVGLLAAAAPQSLIIQIQNAGTTIGTYVSYLKLNCSTNVTCTASGSTVTVTASGSGGGVSSFTGDGTVVNNVASTGAVTLSLANTPTGTGGIVLANTPTLVTPNIGAATGTSLTVSGQLVSSLATGTAPFSVTSTTNVPNLNASSLSGATFASPGAIGGTSSSGGQFTTLTASSSMSIGQMFVSHTAPTAASGFSGTAPTLVTNGTAAFSITINATPGSTGVLTFPAATHGWHVSCDDITTQSATVFRTVQTGAVSTTSVTLTQLTDAGATGTPWTLSDVILCSATAY